MKSASMLSLFRPLAVVAVTASALALGQPLVDGGSPSVAEPATFGLFAVGLAGLGLALRRRRKAAALH